jgi:hypothetical protein
MRLRSTVALATASSCAVLLLTACGAGEGAAEAGERTTIAGLLGAPTGGDQTDWMEQERQVQVAIADCMQQDGWEYIPVEQPDGVFEYSEEDELARIQREGLGIAYYTLNQTGEGFGDPYAEWTDPNEEYVTALSEAERTAYYESLYGTEEEQNADTATEVDPETGEEYQVSYGYGAGCSGEAYTLVQGDDPTQSEAYWQAAQKFYEDLYARIEADPRIIKANEDWVSCMADAGYTYTGQDAFWETSYNDLQTRHDDILGDSYNQDPFEGWSEAEINAFFEESSQEEIDAMFPSAPELTSEQRSALEALLQDEIEIATANYECSATQQEEFEGVYADIEEQFALEHEGELEALAASLVAGT